jgi:hypothetical protein
MDDTSRKLSAGLGRREPRAVIEDLQTTSDASSAMLAGDA